MRTAGPADESTAMNLVTGTRDTRPSMMSKLMVSAASAAAVVTGGMVLCGWAFDIPALKSILPGWVTMKPNAALAFVLLGLALQLPALPAAWLNDRGSIHLLRLARGCGWLAGLIGLLTLCEYFFDWNSGFDQWLFTEPAGTVATSNPGRMAPETALCFLLLAAATSFARLRVKTATTLLVSLALGALVTILALAALLTYVTPVLGAFGWWGKTVMAVHTAILFAALGAAVAVAAWRESPRTWILSGRTMLAYGLGLGLLVMVGITTMRVQNLLIRLNDSAAQFETALHLLETLNDQVTDAQSRVRGYVLTGDEQMRTVHDSSVTAAQKSLQGLRSIKLADPLQQARLARVEALALESLQWFGRNVAARQAGPGVAPELIRHGTQLTGALREDIDQLQLDLKKIVGASRSAHQNAVYFAYVVTWAGMLLSLIVLVLALLAWNREMFARAVAEKRLRDEETRERERAVLLVNEQAEAIETQRKARLEAQELMADAVAARGQAEAMTAQLDKQLDELRRWQKVTLGREGRVLSLKEEINSLLAERGQPPRYPSAVQAETEK